MHRIQKIENMKIAVIYHLREQIGPEDFRAATMAKVFNEVFNEEDIIKFMQKDPTLKSATISLLPKDNNKK